MEKTIHDHYKKLTLEDVDKVIEELSNKKQKNPVLPYNESFTYKKGFTLIFPTREITDIKDDLLIKRRVTLGKEDSIFVDKKWYEKIAIEDHKGILHMPLLNKEEIEWICFCLKEGSGQTGEYV